MKGEVKQGRKEAARIRTAQEKQKYAEKKRESRKRSVSFRDFDSAVAGFLPDLTDLDGIIRGLVAHYRDGGLAEDEYDKHIFDPVKELTALPIGLLDHKELALPFEFVPVTRAEIRAHCERMIIRNRNRELVAFVVAGWPTADIDRSEIATMESSVAAIEEAHQVLDRHVDDLLRLSNSNPEMYRAIICGRHRTALVILEQNGVPKPFTSAQVLLILKRQGLIWCAHDLQLNLARGSIGAANPFGALISSDQVQIKPERVINDLKPHLRLLRLALQLYATTAEEGAGKGPGCVPDDPIASPMAHRLLRQPALQDIDLPWRRKLDAVIVRLRTIKTYGAESFWADLERPISPNEVTAHFSGIWFSGLSNVQAGAVTILRYLQAETEIERMVEERRCDIMPAFTLPALGRRGFLNAQDLLYLYRRELLRDKDYRNGDAPVTRRSKNKGRTTIFEAEKFLRGRGQRHIGDDHGDASSPERTFYLLDVIPEARLSR